jgi:predicted  nucleic acid-binding Zn-ribbon protein
VKASPDDQALLLELQAHDTKLQQLDHRAKSLPEHAAVAGILAQLETVRARVGQQRGSLEDVQLELSRIESDVATVEARIARDTERLQGSSSVKDVAALEQELAALKKRQFDLEEIELAVMERLEERQGEFTATSAALNDLLEQLAAAERERDEAVAGVAAERHEVVAAREVLAGRIPADLLALYERQRSRYGFGASLLRFGVSSVTGVALLSDELASIRAAAPDEVLMCPSSDAILVRTGESGL